ncbi:hypothetical protein [Polaromonas sp. P5_D5]
MSLTDLINVSSISTVGAYTCFLILRALALQRPSTCEPTPPSENLPYLLVVIPVLREQAAIQGCLEHFGQIEYPDERIRVVLVTTEKELKNPHPHYKELTSEALSRLIPIVEDSSGRRIFRHIHYPYSHGNMADQVNYAVRYIFEAYDVAVDPDNTFIAVYNVDSKPEVGVCMEVARRFIASQHICFQQLSAYHVVTSPASTWIQRMICEGFALWQTRWSLLVEKVRYEQSERLFVVNSRSFDKRDLAYVPFERLPFSYTVAHGLYIRLSEFIQMNYLPAKQPNEDAEFGFALPFYGHHPQVLDSLDIAESASTVGATLRQQEGWIVGPLLSFNYMSKILKIFEIPSRGRWRVLVYATRAFSDAFWWVAGPLLFLYTLLQLVDIPSDKGQSPLLIFGTLVVWGGYFWLPTIAMRYCAGKWLGRAPQEKSQSISNFSRWAFAMLPICYLLHGWGGVVGIAKYLATCVSGKPYVKYKTERGFK